ncbi:MAG: dimethyl sulfoxide reductase anchor subunit [Planctomycetia bacterium]|nr:dimethyl sulfoxide reductase anchor subunit [Planctomycetia bacterium]
MVSIAEVEAHPRDFLDGSQAAHLTPVDRYLAEQQELTAVERFAQAHAAAELPLQARYYSSLLPAAPPGPGEQYAFEVDLDACSGCKACVVACNSLNGLDESETWRDVGLISGGSDQQPFQQHVTAACHHCLDPACLNVCPVRAYEKDEITGIVRHLDDQCIGCQYCVLACPYDVPKYNSQRGIVRKCDMCSNRLGIGEAPACVQSCPNSAIRITTVAREAAAEDCELGAFLPGAPDPRQTQPTTHYKTNRVFPRNALPADYYSVQPEHAHGPLVAMLVLTQLSVGAFAVEFAGQLLWPGAGLDATQGLQAGAALFLGLVALGASTLHLGRPHLAFRVVLGLKSSWLSREIVAFGAFALFAAIYAASIWGTAGGLLGAWQETCGAAVVGTGLAGILCSIMIYHCTGRALWTGPSTATRFLLTTALLGLSAALLTIVAAVAVTAPNAGQHDVTAIVAFLWRGIAFVSLAKLAFEASLFRHLWTRQHTPLKRTALLMTRDLAGAAKWRFALGIAGGLLLPAIWLSGDRETGATLTLCAAQFGLLLAGELFERYLFFTAVVAPRMPGGLRT